MESPEQIIRRLQRELKEKDKTIRQKDRTIRQKDREASKHSKAVRSLRERLELEDGLWATGADRLGTDASLLHTREVICDILQDGSKISAMAGLDAGQFDHIHRKFVKESRKHGEAPLFSEDCTPDPGNRCLLDRRSVLLLALFRKRSNVTQDALGVIFGTDQSTVCRYLQFADSVLVKILPTADRINSMVKRARTPRELTASQKRRNKKISSRRMTVEHSIGRIKQWARMTDPYDGTVDEFHGELVVVTGLANFQLLWDKKRKRPRLDY